MTRVTNGDVTDNRHPEERSDVGIYNDQRDCHVEQGSPRNDDTRSVVPPAETTEHIPLYERIHELFPDVKPQQSMAAWDDDEPF